VCWSAEVTPEVGEDGSIFYVTRGSKEEHLDKNLKPSFKSGRTSVGVCTSSRQSIGSSNLRLNCLTT
jgi:hypothetical protein